MARTIEAWLRREWAAVRKSGTMLFAWTQAAVGVAAAVLLDVYSDPSINSAIQSALKPDYVPYYVIAVGLLLRIVRKRNAVDL